MSSRRQREVKTRRTERLGLGLAYASAPSIAIDDPLTDEERVLGASKAVAVVIATVLAHAAILAAFYGLSTLVRSQGWFEKDRQAIEVAVVHQPPPPPPPKPVVEAPPTPPPPPPKKEKKAPPPDPIDIPPEAPPEPEETAPESVVGLDADSTVEGGSGPSFATGNTRMGQTDELAKDPNEIAELPKTNVIIPAKRKGAMTEPEYPVRYREMSLEDSVMVRIVVDDKGNVAQVQVVEPSRHREFNKAAEQAARKDEYEPATQNGVPVQYAFNVKYTFRLTD